jgi:hypothetical protein
MWDWPCGGNIAGGKIIGEAHLCQVLQAEEIDVSFIDHSLSYAENKDNLYKQFGLRFSQVDYNKLYREYEAKANDYNKQPIIKPEKIIKAKKPKVKKHYGEFIILEKVRR